MRKMASVPLYPDLLSGRARSAPTTSYHTATGPGKAGRRGLRAPLEDRRYTEMPKYKSAAGAVRMSAEGTVEGYASTFDREPDSYGDVVAPGAFAESLERWRETGKPIPLLYGHNTGDPECNIGQIVEASEDARGLHVVGEFDGGSPKAQYVRRLVQEGRLWQFSFAYDVRDAGEVEIDGRRCCELRKIDIFEVSLVKVPANRHAEVTDIKSADPAQKSGRRISKATADALGAAVKEMQEAVAAANKAIALIEMLSTRVGMIPNTASPSPAPPRCCTVRIGSTVCSAPSALSTPTSSISSTSSGRAGTGWRRGSACTPTPPPARGGRRSASSTPTVSAGRCAA